MLTNLELMLSENKKLTEQLKKWQKALEELQEETKKGDPDPAVLIAQFDLLTGWVDHFPAFKDLLIEFEEERTKAAQLYNELIRQYAHLLTQECNTSGYRITGDFPNFKIDGLINVKVDKKLNRAEINSKKTSSLAIRTVMEAIRKEHQRIWERSFDQDSFIKKLFLAYEASRQKPSAPEVTLKEIFQLLKAEDTNYSWDLFAADMSRLLEEALVSVQDAKLELLPIRDPRNALYIYNRLTGIGQYLGLIRYRKDLNSDNGH